MNKEPEPMREIHEIQEKLYNEQLHMTNKEKLDAIHKESEEIQKKYGIDLRKISYAK